MTSEEYYRTSYYAFIKPGSIFLFVFAAGFLWMAQVALAQHPQDIFLQNGSFEDVPDCCKPPSGWVDCGFKGETPPDVQPALDDSNRPFFNVTKAAFAGNTYLGMVVRENDTYERVAQRLLKPLKKDLCYTFSIYLCRSDNYLSASNRNEPDKLKEFTQPILLRIWGGDAYCHQKQLLAESPLISNTDWKKYEFEFEVKHDMWYFELEAFYKTPVLFPYNGNILLDNASHITIIPCPTDSKAYAEYKKEIQKAKNGNTKPKENLKTKSNSGTSSIPSKPKQRILKYLDNKMSVGQVFKIEKLYFETDSATIKQESFDVLDELLEYLEKNKKVKIEIGGHTNNRCSEKYCERLSLHRSEAVKAYLVENGIDGSRIVCKGYGRKNPVASNSTVDGRKLNQRVEIKILSISG
ncbi:MAG: OmpA family protein [Saprospiraceae bacterium]|nr:OmpA family protein [Saprospiraceae bacterium]